LAVVDLASGAGDDAAVLAAAGVPAGMLFVRSLNGGVSHTPEEEPSTEDVALAVDMLSDALEALAFRVVQSSRPQGSRPEEANTMRSGKSLPTAAPLACAGLAVLPLTALIGRARTGPS